MKKLRRIIFSLLFIFALAGCGKSSKYPSKLDVTTNEEQFRAVADGDTVAEIKTTKGTIKILLFPEYAPLRVENFRLLSDSGYYDGSLFSRVVKDTLVRAGSPEGTQGTGKSRWGIYFNDEFTDKLHNYTGRVGMVNGGEDKNGSRFYIVTTPTDRDISAKPDEMRGAGWREEVINVYSQIGGAPSFDYRYTVFGQVYEGLDIAYEIANTKTDESGKPQKDIKIESVTVYTVQSGDETSTGE